MFLSSKFSDCARMGKGQNLAAKRENRWGLDEDKSSLTYVNIGQEHADWIIILILF